MRGKREEIYGVSGIKERIDGKENRKWKRRERDRTERERERGCGGENEGEPFFYRPLKGNEWVRGSMQYVVSFLNYIGLRAF